MKTTTQLQKERQEKFAEVFKSTFNKDLKDYTYDKNDKDTITVLNIYGVKASI